MLVSPPAVSAALHLLVQEVDHMEQHNAFETAAAYLGKFAFKPRPLQGKLLG